jgi:hypothetical protein
MNRVTHCAVLFAAVILAASMPAVAATAPPPTADTITFDQYRDWRMHFIEQRQTQIAAELAEKDLSATRRAALERQKAYYDYFAAMTPAERDRRFHDRFDQIDANHDGIIDPAERAAWHEKQRAYYDRPNYRHNVASDDPGRR